MLRELVGRRSHIAGWLTDVVASNGRDVNHRRNVVPYAAVLALLKGGNELDALAIEMQTNFVNKIGPPPRGAGGGPNSRSDAGYIPTNWREDGHVKALDLSHRSASGDLVSDCD
jgi:hypothetical protein